LVREPEQQVRRSYPRLRVEALVTILLWDEPERLERVVGGCIAAQRDGLGGVDLLYQPYDTEANWREIYAVATRLADAGLGITAHVGEVSSANIAAALKTPGLTRFGHAVYAARDPHLLEWIRERGITVECCLTCNVVLGAVPSIEQHPLPVFMRSGIPVVLGTDDPVQVGTTIGREYAVAEQLGLTPHELWQLTVNAVRASFTTAERRAELLDELERHATEMSVARERTG
jgi:adenosine deaminase